MTWRLECEKRTAQSTPWEFAGILTWIFTAHVHFQSFSCVLTRHFQGNMISSIKIHIALEIYQDFHIYIYIYISMCIFKQLRGFLAVSGFPSLGDGRQEISIATARTHGPSRLVCVWPTSVRMLRGDSESRSMRLSLNSLGYPKIADLGCFRMMINWDFGGRVSDKAYYMILEFVLLAISGGYLTHILSFLKQMTRSCLGRLKSRCYLWDLRRRFYLIMQGGIFNGKAVPFERGEWMRMPAVILEQ